MAAGRGQESSPQPTQALSVDPDRAALRTSPDRRPGPDAAAPLLRPAPSHTPPCWTPGSAPLGHRPGYSRPTTGHTFKSLLLQAAPSGEPGCARRSHTRAPPASQPALAWDGPRATPGSWRDRPGPSPAAPATVAVRGAASQSLGSGRCGAGLPLIPGVGRQRPSGRSGPFPPRPLRTPLQAPARSLPGPSGPLPGHPRPPRSYRAVSSGRWARRAGAQLAARPDCRKCQKTETSALAEGGRERAGGRRRRAEGGGRGGRKTRAGSAAPERALQGPHSLGTADLSSPPFPWRALELTHTEKGMRRWPQGGWGHSPEKGQEAGRGKWWPVESASRGSHI